MLYFKSVKIKNFRQLRDIGLSFGLNQGRPLTVIRAENRTGKTTFLTALAWALFGNDALKARKAYRMHPIDWDIQKEGSTVPISVEIHFTNEDEETLNKEDYIVRRECIETLETDGRDSFTVSGQDPVLYRVTERGHETIPNPTAYITRRLFPLSLKDIFITDGDKTLSFIDSEDTANNRKERVKRAVRSLMQLEALERASAHVKDVRRDINRTIEYNSSSGSNEIQILKEYNDKEIEYSLIPQQLDVQEENLSTIKDLLSSLEDELSQAYTKVGGDPQEKAVELARLKQEHAELLRDLDKQYLAMGNYLKNNSHMIYAQFCQNDFRALDTELTSQIEKGVIPDVMPQIIKERMQAGTCICGLKLSEHPDVLEHFKKLADTTADSEQTMFLLQLKHDLVNWTQSTDASYGFRQFSHSSGSDLIRIRKKIRFTEDRISDLSAVLEQTKDVDIDSLRMRINQARADEREILELQGQIKANERLLGARLAELKKQKDQIVKKVGKKDAAENRLTAADDILRIIVTTIEALGEDTLNEVSIVMNDIFQKINVQDEADQSVIISVAISQDHEIVVNGINGKRLVPSTDISGAQKRALTLAFIFATVQVSGRELPNIIDTPLGTQSGELKRLMLEYTALNTKQAILFLTSSEIAGVEDVIRKYTDKYWTLTHADHYPRELINKPPVSTKSAYICACDIQSSCVLCARKGGDK